MPPYWHDSYYQGVWAEIKADMATALTDSWGSRRPFFLPSVCVCKNWCVLFMDQGYFSGGGPSSRPRCIGPFIAPSSIFISAPLFSPISNQLTVSSIPLHQSHTSLCGNIPTSRRLHPTLYNGFCVVVVFFFTLTQWLKKKIGRRKGGGRERRIAATAARVLPTVAVNRSTASVAVAEQASSMADCDWWWGWVEKERNDGRTRRVQSLWSEVEHD